MAQAFCVSLGKVRREKLGGQQVQGVAVRLDQDADVQMTTIGFQPPVRIDLPAEYRPPAAVLVEISDVVKATLQQTRRCA